MTIEFRIQYNTFNLFPTKHIITEIRTNSKRKFRNGVKKLYEKYAKLKKMRGVTDYRVAKETQITRSTFTEWKSGRSIPKPPKIQKIANYFNVPIGYFYDEGAN